MTVNPASLTFTSANWNTAQTVRVRTVDDRVDNGPDRTVEITHTATVGGGVDIALESLTVTVTDDDTRGIVVSQASRALEEGGTATYTVALVTQPTADVTVDMASSDAGAVSATASLNFTTTNWGAAQTVTLRAPDNAHSVPAGVALTVAHAATGGDYEGLTGSDVAVRVLDDDSKAVSVSETALTVAENSGEGTYTVVLGSRPTEDVRVAVASGTPGAARVSRPSLIFTPSSWNTPRTVTVTGPMTT